MSVFDWGKLIVSEHISYEHSYHVFEFTKDEDTYVYVVDIYSGIDKVRYNHVKIYHYDDDENILLEFKDYSKLYVSVKKNTHGSVLLEK